MMAHRGWRLLLSGRDEDKQGAAGVALLPFVAVLHCSVWKRKARHNQVGDITMSSHVLRVIAR
jgi:hypothetical protein